MSLSIYDASVPVFTRGLTNLRHLLQKAREHAEAKKFEPSILLASRLYPDMHPLTRQVQFASDSAKFCVSRLADVEPPKYEDNEVTFEDLDRRIGKTIAYLEGFDSFKLLGSESRTVTLSVPSGKLDFIGQDYLLNFALPNFFFHVTTAYAILRHNGVELGKFDYLGRVG